jgi:hypothetical protein
MPEHQKAPYVAKAEAAKAQYDMDKANYGEPLSLSLSLCLIRDTERQRDRGS